MNQKTEQSNQNLNRNDLKNETFAEVNKVIANNPNSGMAAVSNDIQWPAKGKKISTDEYKNIMYYARERSIELSGFKQYDGDINTIKELIDDAENVIKNYPELTNGKKKITIMLDETMNNMDFAITRGHIISINANAYRNSDILKKEYEKLEKDGWFVKGTDYLSSILQKNQKILIKHVKRRQPAIDYAKIQQAKVENAAILEAVSMGIDSKTIPYLLKMADLSAAV